MNPLANFLANVGIGILVAGGVRVLDGPGWAAWGFGLAAFLICANGVHGLD